MRGSAGAARAATDAVMKVRREMRAVIGSSYCLPCVDYHLVECTEGYRTTVTVRNLPPLTGNVKRVAKPARTASRPDVVQLVIRRMWHFFGPAIRISILLFSRVWAPATVV